MEQPDEFYSLVGGNLVITNPRQKKHAGTYVCVARNIYGTVISKEARVKFGCEHVKPAGAAALWCSCVMLFPCPGLGFEKITEDTIINCNSRFFCVPHPEVVEEFPQEERDPVYVKEGQGAVLLCAPPKVWPRT